MKTLTRLLAVSLLAASAPLWGGPYSDLYVFGDSLSDSGNVLSASPNLSFLPVKPVPGAPYFQGRASNGLVAVDVLAQQLGLTLEASLSGGNNFAYGGARTDTHAFEVLAPVLFPGQTVDVNFDVLSQLDQFNAANPVVDANALYVVFAGSNNLQDAIRAAGADPANAAAIARAAVENAVLDLGVVLGRLRARGARNFLVPNAPNLALVPRIAQDNPQAAPFATLLSREFNNALEGALAANFANVNVIYFDLFTLLQQVVGDPAAFGLTNIADRCYGGDDILFTGGPAPCANADEFLFWDGIHPTASVHAVLGERFALAVGAGVPEPGTFALFAIALLPFVRCRFS